MSLVRRGRLLAVLSTLLGMNLLFGCASTSYQTQGYAKLSNSKDFEEDYAVVWKGALAALGEYKVEEKDQEKGRIQTDWIYSTSNEKFIEYQVNGFPRKKYLQARYKFLIMLDRKVDHVNVKVMPDEQVEKLKSDGSFDSWNTVSEIDSIRANDLIKNIELKILSRPNI